MENFKKYLPVSIEDLNWGLTVLNTGTNCIKKNENYPSIEHPKQHYFNWNKGRILDEYQIIYISKGSGHFESASSVPINITEGTIILLFPGEWHRFKPDSQMGWDEYWVGCNGNIIKNMENQKIISRSNPILTIGINEQIISLFTEIIEKARTEKTGYQMYISGIVIHIIGLIQYKLKQENQKPSDHTEEIITKSQLMLRKIVTQNIRMETITAELNVSYPWFRKAFKNYTGISPKQYLLQLRIEQAKTMLTDETKPIKEIAFELNFESASFFSKQFKQKTGKTPAMYRNFRTR